MPKHEQDVLIVMLAIYFGGIVTGSVLTIRVLKHIVRHIL